MSKSGNSGVLASLTVQPSALPIYRRIFDELRNGILDGRFPPGTRLPATRVLASELDVSRNTILHVFEELLAEGYLESRVGDGTYVAKTLPEDYLLTQDDTFATSSFPDAPDHMALSGRGKLLAELAASGASMESRAFSPDIPAFDAFPLDAWGHLMSQSWRANQPNILGPAIAQGYKPLRDEITQHLQAARGVRCSPDQVIVTSGTQQSLDLIARLMMDHGDPVWIEDPGYIPARNVWTAAGARLVPVPVDAEGLNVCVGKQLEPRPRFIFTSPSRQYPLGMTLSIQRRKELLSFAREVGAWIVEDDYDSEFRYSGYPVPAMQSYDPSHVIYLGTFSNSMLPTLRLGYMIVPEALVQPFITAKSVIDRHPPLLEQTTLSKFMAAGQFAAHVRKMRRLYLERQTVLLDELSQHLAGFISVTPADTGMHLVGRFNQDIDDRSFCEAAKEAGISLRPLSIYYLTEPRQHGLILGFAAFPRATIVNGARRLASFARRFCARSEAGPDRRDTVRPSA
ncbi:MAG: PLP-dependent aminotransferase family protein [Bradyrhizobium sp.]